MSQAEPSATASTPQRPPTSKPAAKKPPLAATAARSTAARRRATAVLEVLAGARTPADAALALGLSLGHYYHLEGRVLRAVVTACEPQPVGRLPDPASEVRALRQQCQRLQQQLARQQALARLAQRTVGLGPPAPPKGAAAKKRHRRPTVRALQAAKQLCPAEAEPTTTPAAAADGRPPVGVVDGHATAAPAGE